METPPEALPSITCNREIPRAEPSEIVFNRKVGPGWYLLRLREPQIAAASKPGQFVQILCSEPGSWDPMLRRPFSVYDTDVKAGTFDILYIVTGRGTRWMAALPESPGAGTTHVDTIGPFGNRFTKAPADSTVILVGGGVGVAPLYFFAKELCAGAKEPPRALLLMGARSSKQLQGIEDFRQLPIDCRVSTNDGSEGYRGFVTGLLEKLLEKELADVDPAKIRIYGCGPTGMNEALRQVSVSRALSAEICLESYMACGFGICFACVLPIRKDLEGEIYNRRICLEGPVFDARLMSSLA